MINKMYSEQGFIISLKWKLVAPKAETMSCERSVAYRTLAIKCNGCNIDTPVIKWVMSRLEQNVSTSSIMLEIYVQIGAKIYCRHNIVNKHCCWNKCVRYNIKYLWNYCFFVQLHGHFNSLRPSDVYMRQRINHQIMACRLDGAKPLSDTMLAYY